MHRYQLITKMDKTKKEQIDEFNQEKDLDKQIEKYLYFHACREKFMSKCNNRYECTLTDPLHLQFHYFSSIYWNIGSDDFLEKARHYLDSLRDDVQDGKERTYVVVKLLIFAEPTSGHYRDYTTTVTLIEKSFDDCLRLLIDPVRGYKKLKYHICNLTAVSKFIQSDHKRDGLVGFGNNTVCYNEEEFEKLKKDSHAYDTLHKVESTLYKIISVSSVITSMKLSEFRKILEDPF